MPSLLIFIIGLPLLGAAGILGLSLVPRLRPAMQYVALAVIGVTTVLLLLLRWAGPVEQVLSLWQPSALLGIAPVLQNQVSMHPLAFIPSLVLCAAGIKLLGRSTQLSPRFWAALLGLFSAALVSLWAANPLATIVGWAIYDLWLFAVRIAAGGSQRVAIRGLVLGNIATLLLWGGVLLSSGEGGSELWTLMEPSGAQLTLWVAAGVLRLWVYPFHFPIPDDLGDASAFVWPLLSPLLGWGLCLHLVLINDGVLPAGDWIAALAVLTVAVGGFLAWSSRTPRAALPWIGMEVTGAVLLAAALADEHVYAVISSGFGVSILGAAGLLSASGLRRKEPWWSIPALVGAAASLGLPLTLGFIPQASILGGLVESRQFWQWAMFFIGTVFSVASLVRWLLDPTTFSPPPSPWRLVTYGIGMGLPVLILFVAGFYPRLLIPGVSLSLGAGFARPGLTGWVLWGGALACGGVLAWQDTNVRSRIQFLFGAAREFLRLEWLYEAVGGAVGRAVKVLRVVDDVVGGAGALLWSLLLFLLLLLVWSNS